MLDTLHRDPAKFPANETIALRWTCHQALAALDDKRAGTLLEQLFADVQARAAELTGAADRKRLIQAIPIFRAIVAAQAGQGQPRAAAD